MIPTIMKNYGNEFKIKYYQVIENRWFWAVFTLIILVSTVGYAFYCTGKGFNYSGHFKLRWPGFWQMGIGCKK
ncbi:hypothetical protein [Oenococcus sicerae]|uniref:Uncharacterized protein n=1 Tax=Oenococcus sicerae TaxID=2203724 RepID=A0AAJ1VNU8_9LACO|nr:hypothetical protein [Oenococcus sicerae]MDN6900189.1 hypothetical protein [Oenococcus sicerae]